MSVEPLPASGRLLGVDLGDRRIGLAVTDSARTVATGFAVLGRAPTRREDHERLAAAAAEHGAVGLVVGVPYTLSGETGPAAERVLAEIEELEATGVVVATVDERLTTVTAAAALRRGGRTGRKQRQVIDAAAAADILQTWIDRERAARGSARPA